MSVHISMGSHFQCEGVLGSAVEIIFIFLQLPNEFLPTLNFANSLKL